MGPIQVHKNLCLPEISKMTAGHVAAETSDLLLLSMQTDVWFTENRAQNNLGYHQIWHLYLLENKAMKVTKKTTANEHTCDWSGGGGLPYLLGVKARFWYLLECSASKGPQQQLLRYLLGY